MWVVKDCTGISFTLVVSDRKTLLIIGLSDLAVTFYGIGAFTKGEEWTGTGKALMTLFQSLIGLSVTSYMRCIFTNPGKTPYIEPPDIPLEQLRFCEKCQQWKPARTHHCSTCNICVHRVPST